MKTIGLIGGMSWESSAEYYRLVNQAVDDFVAFLDREDIMEPKPFMAPALRERVGRFSPADGQEHRKYCPREPGRPLALQQGCWKHPDQSDGRTP